MRKTLYPLFTVFLAILVFGCDSDNDTSPAAEKTIYGQSIPVGNGIASSWVTLDAAGNPTAIGVQLTKEALNGLPEPALDDPMMGMVYYEIDLPAEAKAKTPFNHIGVDWNPMGHPPAFYQVPHLDAHFYMITPAEQQQIGDEVSDPKMQISPDAKYLPADYIDAQVNVPMMGKHWFDKFSPELNGQQFTQTFIYGSYNGEIAFLEPMFTMEYLLSRPNDTFPIKPPADFQQKGLYYPATYSIRYDPESEMYVISLNDMQLK
ncbi:DUF5602 domain-containing protein [Pontibacter sp. 172403-2]|uniref:DUF5602 domain-containing protein n=1 Tax=Pontibacter rufus TaxID=2791028 RepID=UPI0018AF6235|nr:DUF5602 domain-containing protein [Pontibacter sp. 172403-2]MBF9251932.1 DUF5602 domain-containing protein [Pontibacter sp. 172403-2]